MRALIASAAAIGLIATPVLAATTTKIKTTTTKVTPTSTKAVSHASVKKHMTRSHAMAAKAARKPAQSAKKTG